MIRATSSLLALLLAAATLAGACAKKPAPTQAPPSPEHVWLSDIGTGPGQTARACGRGGRDRISAALCREPRPTVDSLEALYRVLGFVGEQERLVATTTHSLGLSVRTVSPANPRTVVFVNNMHYQPPIPYDKLGALAFSRGEQFVELVALDTNTYDWNFYLLAFEQACNASRCTPEDLLTEKIERNWTQWTLYSEQDLVDTPLDCASCHLPYGKGTHKLLLMRELPDPWLHWGDFHGVEESADCSQDGPITTPERRVPGEGLAVLQALEGASGRYAGVPVPELYEAKSGRNLSDFVVDSILTITESPYGRDFPQGGFLFRGAPILCERLDGESHTWEQYRAELTELGLPVAYHGEDVLDPARRAELLEDRAGVLRRHEQDSAFDVASSWMDRGVAEAVGLIPREQDSARQILRQMCVRCHSKSAPPGSHRARFDAGSLDRIDPDTARAIRERIRLPRTSPKLMPPLRSGELTPSAIARIESYLREHCSAGPGACD